MVATRADLTLPTDRWERGWDRWIDDKKVPHAWDISSLGKDIYSCAEREQVMLSVCVDSYISAMAQD